MGRLIDADALIETMKKTEEEYEDAMTRPSWWTAYSVISEQPTAYDVEKVVEELEENCDIYSVKYYQEDMEVKAVPIDDAIDIAKRGGVE